MEITKDEFEAYEKVRVSGVTNMFMVDNVSDLSGLERDKIMAIMSGYDELSEKYPEVTQ